MTTVSTRQKKRGEASLKKSNHQIQSTMQDVKWKRDPSVPSECGVSEKPLNRNILLQPSLQDCKIEGRQTHPTALCSGSTLVYHYCLQHGPLYFSRYKRLSTASGNKSPIAFTFTATDFFLREKSFCRDNDKNSSSSSKRESKKNIQFRLPERAWVSLSATRNNSFVTRHTK